MSVRRIMGTEVEYGVQVLADPHANPVESSSLLVNAYASADLLARRARWDFEEEHPLRDARGHDLARAEADRGLLTDEETGLANVILTNGARLYVDHAHPEFSGPEVTSPLDVVRWDKAGEVVMQRAADLVARNGGPEIRLYKNNTDNKGVSYGAHENYLTARSTGFGTLVRHLVPFLATRQVFCGAGRVGLGTHGAHPGFQLSQRADFIETTVALETTMRRPIVNSRDEPHADAQRYRRLHLIIGDANLSQVATFLKVGTTALVLDMIEADTLKALELADPVREVRAISHDPSLRHLVELADGRRMTAVEVQRHYLDQAQAHVDHTGDTEPQTHAVLKRWADVLERLEHDPFSCAQELDWVAKLQLLERYRERDGLDWDAAKLHLVDLQYADLRPTHGLHQRLVAAGRMHELISTESILMAVHEPPADTRAYFRGECLRRYPNEVAAASWDSVIFDLPGRSHLQRIPTPDPWRGTQAHVGSLLDTHPRAEDLFEALTGHGR